MVNITKNDKIVSSRINNFSLFFFFNDTILLDIDE